MTVVSAYVLGPRLRPGNASGTSRLPFRFIGQPGGLHPHQPTASLAGDELRAPLEPMPDEMAFLLADQE
jgi:hypothetical protein